jgi:hypothetical protein
LVLTGYDKINLLLGDTISDKAKRKHQYRRWWAFRGLLIALIVFLGAIGYLFTRRQPEGEVLYFYKEEMLWRINTLPNAIPEFMAEMAETSVDFNWGNRVYDEPKNWLVYSISNQRKIRYINLTTGEDTVLLNCSVICISFDLHTDGSRLVYIYYYPSTEAFEIRQFNIEQNVDELLFQVPVWLYQVRWINEYQIEYTTNSGSRWLYDFNTGVQQEIEMTNYRLYSPDGSHYIVKSYHEGFMRWYYEYTVYNSANDEPVKMGVSFFTESDAPICWQPNGDGVLYHERSTASGMPINRLSYYDVETGENRYIHQKDGRDPDDYFFRWSPSSSYILLPIIEDGEGSFQLYDIQSRTRQKLIDNTVIPFWLNEIECWRSFPPS